MLLDLLDLQDLLVLKVRVVLLDLLDLQDLLVLKVLLVEQDLLDLLDPLDPVSSAGTALAAFAGPGIMGIGTCDGGGSA